MSPKSGVNEIISGAIGVGKSYLVIYKILQSLYLNRPCCYIDPRGDTYYNLQAILCGSPEGRELWEKRKEKILFVNPVTTGKHIVPFNALAPLRNFLFASPDTSSLLANIIVSLIRQQSSFEGGDANRMTEILLAVLISMIEGGEGKYTLAEVPLLFTPSFHIVDRNKPKPWPHNNFVRELLKKVVNPMVQSFWKDQWDHYTDNAQREWPQSSLGRTFQYLVDQKGLETITSPEYERLDFRKVIDEGYWVFVNLPFHLLGEMTTSLIGDLIIWRLYYAACQRLPGGSFYRVITDETRFFVAMGLDRILETSRPYNFRLTMVVQSINQLCRMSDGKPDMRIKDAVKGQVQLHTAFRHTDPREALELAEMIYPPMGLDNNRGQREAESWYLSRLPNRKIVSFDTLTGQATEHTTPTIRVPAVDSQRIMDFENEHLERTGAPAELVREANQKRRLELESLIGQQTRQGGLANQPAFGGTG